MTDTLCPRSQGLQRAFRAGVCMGIILMLGFKTAMAVGSVEQLPESTQNACDSAFVTQSANELSIKVKPTGVDDTVNIQCALDWAVNTGMPVVKLSADTFFISSIVIEGFNGTLQGFTTDTTMIEVLDDSIACTTMANSGRVPAAIKFIKGEPRLRFLTIRAHESCKTNSRFLAIVHFTGDAADSSLCTNDVVFGSVDRIILDGTSRATGPWWGILVGAESDNFSVCQGKLLGTFKLNRSALANTRWGISSALKAGAQVDINFNDFVGNYSAIWMVNSNQNTTITRNNFYGESKADEPHFSIMLASLADAPTTTRMVVNNNYFNLASPSGRNSIGVLTQQPGKVINVSSIVTNNRFVLRGDTTWGVYATDVSNTHVSTNRFTGTTQGAVLVAGTTPVRNWTITANNGFKNLVSSSLRDIWLRENTSRCIVGPGQGASVHDFGSGNSILSLLSPSPTVLQNKVMSDQSPKPDEIEINAEISRYLQETVQILAVTASGDKTVSGAKHTDTGKQPSVTQSLRVTRASPQAITNPCDDSFVKQAINELVIKVTPNGVDDTVNIQCALDWAIDTGMPVVQLSAQKFYISSLAARKFNGSLQGVTMESTVVEVLDNSIACISFGASGQISAAIKFIQGEPRLRFMTIRADKACINEPQLDTIVHFTGEPADRPDCGNDVIFGVVDRVIVDGTAEFTGPNEGIKVGAESDYFFGGCQRKLLGTFKLNRSTIANTQTGIATTMKSAAQVDINFNTFTGNRYSVYLGNGNQNTTITGNQFIGDAREGYWGLGVSDGYYGIVYGNWPGGPTTTRVVIHSNNFNVTALSGLDSSGVFGGSPPGIVTSSVITNNRFVLNGDAMWGIKSNSISNTHVSANSFTGNGAGAIMVSGDDPVTGWTITANKGLEGFFARSADIALDANTSRCIVGPGQGATFVNHGAGNSILSSSTPSPLLYQNKVKSDWPAAFDVSEITAGFQRNLEAKSDSPGGQQ